MSEEESDTTKVSIWHGEDNISDSRTSVTVDENWKERVDEFVEKSPYKSRAAALRSLVFIGMRAYALNNPVTSNPDGKESEDGFSPVTIRELIPEGKDNAVHVFDELPDKIEDRLLDIVVNDEKIKRDGSEVYR